MGRGIAYGSPLGGFQPHLQDLSEQALEQASQEVSALLERGVATGRVEEQAAVEARRRLRIVRGLAEAVREADLVVEAGSEAMDLKIQLFAEVVRHRPRDPVLASKPSP